jgi:hypothetical protein
LIRFSIVQFRRDDSRPPLLRKNGAPRERISFNLSYTAPREIAWGTRPLGMKKGTPKLGDVYEVPTPVGLAYIQFTHLKPIDEFPLIRVLPRIYQSRPRDIGEIVSQQELYFAFYVLPYALKSGQITFVSNEPIPHWAKEFPLMRRSASFNGRPGWLIGPASTPGTPDGLRTMMRVTELSPDQKKLSFFNEIVPHAALVHNIVRGWTPERDEELTAHAIAEAESKKAKELLQSKGEYIDHYLYFQKRRKHRKPQSACVPKVGLLKSGRARTRKTG